MLDEEEFDVINKLYNQGILPPEEFCKIYNQPEGNNSFYEKFRPMREKYQEITGFEETNHLAILHHRISIYGEPCQNCGKPLRTPKAAFCASCGQVKE